MQEAVFRAIYTQQNASVQTTVMMLQDLQTRGEDRGREWKGVVRDEGVKWLADEEMEACRAMGQKTVGRPWGLWVREVEANGLYVNEA